MKISKETLSVMKSFGHINPNLLLKAGSNKLETIAVAKNIFANAVIPEEFPINFGIYDIQEFLSVLNLFNDPDLEFSDKFVKIKEGKNSITFWGAAENVLTVPDKEIKFPIDAEINFSLPSSVLDTINKSASVLKANDLFIIGDGEKIVLRIGDKKVDSSNSYEVEVGETSMTFTGVVKISLLKLYPGDYDVTISSKKISKFRHVNRDMTFYIALESF